MNYYSSFPEGSALWSQCREGMHESRLSHLSSLTPFPSPPLPQNPDILTHLLQPPGAHNLSTTHAIEGNCFVVLASSFFTKAGVERMRLGDGQLYHIGGGGCAAVIAPDGRKLTADLGEEEEGLVVADCDMSEILKVKAMLDVHGHYSRPDLLWLGVDYREKEQVRPEGMGEQLTKA